MSRSTRGNLRKLDAKDRRRRAERDLRRGRTVVDDDGSVLTAADTADLRAVQRMARRMADAPPVSEQARARKEGLAEKVARLLGDRP